MTCPCGAAGRRALLLAAVSAALDEPASGADRRARCRKAHFGACAGGHAAERIAKKISELGL